MLVLFHCIDNYSTLDDIFTPAMNRLAFKRAYKEANRMDRLLELSYSRSRSAKVVIRQCCQLIRVLARIIHSDDVTYIRQSGLHDISNSRKIAHRDDKGDRKFLRAPQPSSHQR